jgi:hypothetical protein
MRNTMHVENALCSERRRELCSASGAVILASLEAHRRFQPAGDRSSSAALGWSEPRAARSAQLRLSRQRLRCVQTDHGQGLFYQLSIRHRCFLGPL